MIPQEHLTQCAQTLKLKKHALDGFLNFAVRRHLDAADATAAKVTNRHLGQDLPAENLLPIGLLGSLAKNAQLELAHSALEPQKQTVIEQTWIIDAFVIDHDRFGEHTQIDQVMPVTVVASKSGGFQCEDRANFAVAHRRKKPTKSRSFTMATARNPKILINDHHVLEPKLPSPILKRVLPAAALLIIAHLVQGRLADINMGGTFQMLRCDLIVHRSFRFGALL